MTDYGSENPLYYDYYGFTSDFFQLKFKSRGDSDLARRIVSLYHKVGERDPGMVLHSLVFARPG